MTQEELNEVLRKHKLWLEDEDGGEQAELQHVNLWGMDLRDANLDYSCLPLWCGGSRFKADVKLVYQILAHVATIQCDDPEFEKIRRLILPFAQKSHRAKDLWLIGKDKE